MKALVQPEKKSASNHAPISDLSRKMLRLAFVSTLENQIKKMEELAIFFSGKVAEPPNGWIKSVLGFRQFSMWGLKKANADFKLVCMSLNLRIMSDMQMA